MGKSKDMEIARAASTGDFVLVSIVSSEGIAGNLWLLLCRSLRKVSTERNFENWARDGFSILRSNSSTGQINSTK